MGRVVQARGPQPPAEQASGRGAARLTTKNGDVGVAPDRFDGFKFPRFLKTAAQGAHKKTAWNYCGMDSLSLS